MVNRDEKGDVVIHFSVRECESGEYVRLKRPLWAKLLFPSRLLYQCTVTQEKMLVRPEEIERAVWDQRFKNRDFVDRLVSKNVR